MISFIKDANNNKIEIFLIGNKIDDNDKRMITKKKANEIANNYNIKYFEISCLNGLNVYEIMNEIILTGYKYYENENKEKESINLKTQIQKKKIEKKCC